MEAGKEPHLSSRGLEQKARTFEKLPSRLSLVLFLKAGLSPVKNGQLHVYPKGF